MCQTRPEVWDRPNRPQIARDSTHRRSDPAGEEIPARLADVVLCAGLLRETDYALNALERALRQRNPLTVWVGVGYGIHPVRDEPRYQRTVEAMGLSPATMANRDRPRTR